MKNITIGNIALDVIFIFAVTLLISFGKRIFVLGNRRSGPKSKHDLTCSSFDQLITKVLADSVSVCPADLCPIVLESLKNVAQYFKVDYAHILVISEKHSQLSCDYEWCAKGVQGWSEQLQSVDLASLPWLAEGLLNGRPLILNTLDALPEEAVAERRLPHIKAGIKSMICVPFRFHGLVNGCLTLGSFSRVRVWPDEMSMQLKGLGDAFASSIERQRAATALANSERKYRMAFENAPLGIFQNSLDGRVISINNKLAEIVGAPSAEFLINHIKNIATEFYVNPDERSRLIEAALQSDGFVTGELMERRLDGAEILVRSRLRAVRDEAGNPLYIEGFLEDITEQKKNLDALTEAVAFDELATSLLAGFASCPSSLIDAYVGKALQRIADFMKADQGVIVLVSDDRLSYSCTHEYSGRAAQSSCRSLQNISVESLRKAGSHVKRLSDNSPFRIDDLLPLEAVEIISEKVMTNCASSVSIPILRPDGGLKGILKLGAVLQRDEFKQNDINRLRVVAEAVANVLQRARAEEAVTASELNYRSIFENAPIGIFQSSAEGKLLSVNERLATMMQFQSASDAVAAINDLRSQIYVNPEDRDNLLKEVLAADGFIRRECDFYRRDGSIFVGGISLRGVKDKEGRFQFLEGFIEDITEAKAVSDSLQRRFEIDKLITGVVAEFASCDAKDVDYSINRALKLLAGAFKSEQAYIVMVSPDGKSYTATHEWCVEDAPKMISVYQNVSFGSIPWTESRIMSDQVINIPDLEKYTEIETPNELDAISASYGRRSTLSVPIHGKAGIIAGMIGMASYSREVTWSESDITKLRIAGDAVAGVIERKRVEEAAQRQSEYDEIIRSTLARFATCAPEDIDASVEQALCHISQCFGGENSYLTLFSDDFKSYSCSHEWMDREYPPSKHRFQNLSFGTLPYIEQQILSDKIVTSNGAEDDVLRQLRSNGVPIVPGGISSLLIVPVHGVAGTIIGMVGLNSYKRKMCWTSKDIDQLRVVGNAIANIIERKKADTALKLNNISLEQRIVARTADLEEARRTAIEIMHDVDEQRRRAEEALAKLEFTTEHLRLLSQAVDNSPAMVMIMDDSRLIEYVNPKFTEVTGYSPSEVLGSDRTLLASDSNEDDGSSELTAALDAGKAWSGEICNRRKSGELFWEYASFAPIKGPDGDVRHYVAVKEDITGRRRMQDELRLARDAAEAANRTKSLFLANMSHEIRTPMNAILGFSQLLQNSRAFVGVEKQHLDIINRSGEHLLALINDILEMSKIEAGRVVLNQNPVDLPSLVSDLSIMFRMRSTDKNIAFALEQIGRLPEYVNTDENKLRQILTNLLGNAVKLTETGGVVLRVSVGPTKYSNYCIIAEVEDTGPGIADHEKSKVFKPFEQTASGIRTRSGTGLGLAISMQFAQMLGGEITFTSTVDIGSIFRLVIPVQKVKSLSDTSHPSKLRVAGLSPKCKVRKVLVVDDELENRILLSSMLNDVGFETNEAVEGASSLALFEEWRPDVILMDAQMPGMDGYEAIRRLRSDPDGKQIPIIAISASAFDDDRQRMLDAGANDFLSKPLRVDSVYSAIASASGASYRYLDNLNADEIPSKSSAESAELKKHAASLPSDIAAKIRQATVDADFDTVITLVDQISDVDRGVADSLRAMAEQYEATRIMNLLSAES